MLQDPFVTCPRRVAVLSIKKHLVVATTYHNDKWLYKAVNLLKWDIKWEIHKRTRQGVSAKLESYIY